jgi:hypothetical protein
MRNPNIAPSRQKGYLDFEPVMHGGDGKPREIKAGEQWKLMQERKFTVDGEPLEWLLLDHVPFKKVVGWYVNNWWWDAYTTVRFLWMARFRVTASRWYVPCEPGKSHLMEEKVTDLEHAARLWRTAALLALIVGISIGAYLAA